jgi:Ribosomal protein L13
VRTTYMAKPGEIDRKWYVVDATDVPLGRLSTVVASILRGKNKPTFTPTWILVITLSLLMQARSL